MLDPAHEEHQSMREWFGGDFDPETFALNAVNAALKRL
ncbi:MAG: plasmid pRiA4b ORF-3 family protein [Lentisphaerae bacterium]|nr:plasmid pRiA4b ORF-3 family protein [Lentisphaerota bacterium]